MNHLPSEVFDLYLDDRLDPSERAAVEAHLAGCSDCSGKLEALRTLASHLDALPLEPLPMDLTPLVLRRIAPAPPPLLHLLHRLGAALLVAEVFAVAALGFWLGAQPTTSTMDLPSVIDPTSLLVGWLGPLMVGTIPPLDDLVGAFSVASFAPTTADWLPLLVVVGAAWLLGNRLLLVDPASVDG